MSAHDCKVFDPLCWRCDLSIDELDEEALRIALRDSRAKLAEAERALAAEKKDHELTAKNLGQLHDQVQELGRSWDRAERALAGLRRLLKRYKQHRRRRARVIRDRRAQWRELRARAEAAERALAESTEDYARDVKEWNETVDRLGRERDEARARLAVLEALKTGERGWVEKERFDAAEQDAARLAGLLLEKDSYEYGSALGWLERVRDALDAHEERVGAPKSV